MAANGMIWSEVIHDNRPIASKSPDHGYKMADDAMMTGFARRSVQLPQSPRNRSRSGPYLLR
jgi:hypothetical protein